MGRAPGLPPAIMEGSLQTVSFVSGLSVLGMDLPTLGFKDCNVHSWVIFLSHKNKANWEKVFVSVDWWNAKLYESIYYLCWFVLFYLGVVYIPALINFLQSQWGQIAASYVNLIYLLLGRKLITNNSNFYNPCNKIVCECCDFSSLCHPSICLWVWI